ncbi:MAG TPA: hypothetical protein VEK08_00525 [Planctomycetota bacterium]|nr:hypothetical protein [Planctomycetota bacterium]
MSPEAAWSFLPLGYALTILIETPILLAFLSRRHSISRRLLAGVWLTACTYPIVVLVLPFLFSSRLNYLLVAETFAPGAECLLFWLAFIKGKPEATRRSIAVDMATVAGANLCSFAAGEWMQAAGWL